MKLVVFRMCIKPEKVEEFKEVVKLMIKSAKENNAKIYNFHQSLEKPNEFIVYEQWSSFDSFNAHVTNLEKLLGPKGQNSILPQKLLDFFENTEDILIQELL